MNLMILKLILVAASTPAAGEAQQQSYRSLLSESRVTVRFETPAVNPFLISQQAEGGFAVYIVLDPAGIQLPMAGGGASGCFSLDLRERIERLKKVVGTFPPAPRKSSASGSVSGT